MKKLFLGLLLLSFGSKAQTTLPTNWGFASPGISTPPTGWSTNLGTGNATYSGGGFSIDGDGLSCRLDVTGEFVTIWFAEKPGEVSYWLRGTGFGANPPFTGAFAVQESADGISWADMRTFTTASPLTAVLTRFVNTPASTSRYVRFYYTAKEPNSNVALDSVLIKSAPVPPLLLSVKQGATTLINNNTFVSGNAANTLFTIQNNGSATDLKIDSIKLSGTNASDFSIGAFDSTTTFGGGKDSFNIAFNSGAPGSRFGTVTIYTSDIENSPFRINLYAIGGTLASEPVSQVPSLSLTNVKTHELTVGFTSTTAEHYIVLRKPSNTITEAPVDGSTYKRGDYIGGAQVAYIGDDTSVFTPNYILAKTDYTFAAFAFNGPGGYENYITTTPAAASTTTPDGQPGTYYNSINPNLPTFITDLNTKIKVVDTVFYSSYASVVVNNYLARDTTGGKKVVTCVYSNDQYIYEDPFLWWTGTSGNPATLTREHTFAQSWMPTNTGGTWPLVGGKEVSEFNDLHHLYPTNQQTANVKRSNNPFGVVVNPTYVAPTGQGKLGTDINGKTVYEPTNDQKGDLARALFYMLVRFNGINGVQWRLPSSQDIPTLLLWHQQDPPSPLEIARNNYIGTVQKNRNPFIDHPEWVNRINFSNMTYVPDPTATLIVLTAPNGGETLTSGTTKNITWTSQNIDTVVIEFKANDSIGWTLISDTVLGSSASYTWTVPAIQTSVAKIRVSDKLTATYIDSSNGSFSIIPPAMSLTLLSPLGGENWKTDDMINDTIKWQSIGVDMVIIQLLKNDTAIKTLQEVLAPNTFCVVSDSMISDVLPGAVYKIKLTASNNKPLVSISPNTFSITSITGLTDQLTQGNIQLFPNPSTGVINLDFTEALAGTISVSDITGRVLYQTVLLQHNTLNIAEKGVYFIAVQTEKGSITKKVIIN